MAQALNADEIKRIVIDFFAKADAGVRLVELLPYINDQFHMTWTPTCQFDGHTGFEEFYDQLRRGAFNRKHEVSDISIDVTGESAMVTFTIHLTAQVWYPPAPKSFPVDNYANFLWVMKRSAVTGRPVVTTYTLTRVGFTKDSIVMNADVVFKYPQPLWGPFVMPPE